MSRLEAELYQTERELLTEEELGAIDNAKDVINSCNEELKISGEWIGLPFDYEWIEFINRFQNVKSAYTRTVNQPPKTRETGSKHDPASINGQPKNIL